MKKTYLNLLGLLFAITSNAQIITIPDVNFKSKILLSSSTNQIAKDLTGNYFKVDANNDGEIQTSEAFNVSYLSLNSSLISDLSGINNFINLNYLDCYNNQLTNLNISGLLNLKDLMCSNNQFINLDLTGLSNLENIDCSNNQLTSIDIIALSNLKALYCSNNPLTNLNVNGLTNLQHLFCSYNQLSSLNLSGLTNLIELECYGNQLTSLNLNGLTNLSALMCGNNQILILNLSMLSNLQSLNCSNNQLTNINLNGLTNLYGIDCSNNQITTLNLNSSQNLTFINCENNQFTTLDLSGLSNLNNLSCGSNNQLTSLFIKNGINENFIYFNLTPNLQYICADGNQINQIQNLITQYGYTNCHVNSYCSFTPGGTFYTIQGNNHYDEDSNGCSSTDVNYPNLQLVFTDGTNSANLIPDDSGAYHYEVQAGTQTIVPTLENPAYFNISPTTATLTFPASTSPFTQDFCITANGTHNDLEVTLLSIYNARPGFDAKYQIVYKNKGTNTQNGFVNLVFDDAVLDYVSATPNFTFQTTNNLTWNFSNLAPFETRTINVTLNLNSPLETPPLNSGDVLNYSVLINGLTDETPIDNASTLNQTVINSFDPNDKICLEGTTVGSEMIGEYVHYMIRFENTGTASAQNIVVKDVIDTTKYDISTLVPIKGSAAFTTRIINTNQVEFIFQNINLPFTTGNNDGYVSFKIKTKPTLVLGDTFSNTANIYFDYNAPIITNTATTTVANLSNQTFDIGDYFTLSPIPTKDILNITNKQSVAISSISIYNITGQIQMLVTNPTRSIDVSSLKTGNYLVKIVSDKGISNCKFIKE